MVELTRFWFEFDGPMPRSCGVTAYNYDDAMSLLKKIVFQDGEVPEIRKMIEDIDISSLDEGKILPNIGAPSFRGIWYPIIMGNE